MVDCTAATMLGCDCNVCLGVSLEARELNPHVSVSPLKRLKVAYVGRESDWERELPI